MNVAAGPTALPTGAMTRRNVLRFSVAAAAAASVTRSSGAAEPGAKIVPLSGKALAEAPIDAHVHVWTPDVERYPLATGFSKRDMQPASFTPDELFAHAVPAGVGRIVLIQMSYYGFDNSYMLAAMDRFPNVFAGVAVIDEHAPRPAEMMRSLAKRRVRGFRIHPGTLKPEPWISSAGMVEMWKCGAQENLAMCCLVNPEALPHVDRMCQKFPDTPVVIDHFGRVGIDGTIREADLAALCRLARHRRVHVKVSAYYALGRKQPPYDDLAPMIRRLLAAFGPERLMWASDSPFQVQGQHTYRASIDLVRERLDFLSAADRGWLLRKTAERVYFRA